MTVHGTRHINVNPQITALIDVDGTQKVFKTKELVDRMANVNAFFDTTLISPGLRYLSADYIVDGMTRFDLIFEVPPHRATFDKKEFFIPWVSVICTVEAESPKYKKPRVVPGSMGIFINETQIYTQLTEVKIPTFVSGIDENGFIQAPEFYGDLPSLKFPVTISQLVAGLHDVFSRAHMIDQTHPDLVKFIEVQLNNGYDQSFTPATAASRKFVFDFSFLPCLEVDRIVSNFGYNVKPPVQIHSLYDFFVSIAKEES